MLYYIYILIGDFFYSFFEKLFINLEISILDQVCMYLLYYKQAKTIIFSYVCMFGYALLCLYCVCVCFYL